MSDIKPAATVIVVKNGVEGLQVLLLRRAETLRFAPNHWVFPGGSVDPSDQVDGDPSSSASARRAAVREMMEETSIGIHEKDLVTFSHWTAPKHVPHRFATWFFVVEVDDGHSVQVDDGEIVEFHWVSPREALELQQSGQFELMVPTYVSLRELLPFQHSQQLFSFLASRDVFAYKPNPVILENQRHYLYQGDAGYEAGNIHAKGPRHRFSIDDQGWNYYKDV